MQNTNLNEEKYADMTLIWHFLNDKLMASVVKDTSVESADLSVAEFFERCRPLDIICRKTAEKLAKRMMQV